MPDKIKSKNFMMDYQRVNQVRIRQMIRERQLKFTGH